MNDQTMVLITRPYQEIVDDILTAMVGGVVREPIAYDVATNRYVLAQPARAVRTISGTRQQEHHAFQQQIDFTFPPAYPALIWTTGGDKPDDLTTFYVSYFPQTASSLLSDLNVGSVTRTLSEAIGREIATVYQQINLAYLSGFVDTATGQALDLVVAILNVRRFTKDYAKGEVTFFRDTGAPDGDVFIPDGAELTTADGGKTFVTLEQRTLQRGQARVDAPVSASGASKGQAGVADPGSINTLVKPIVGIARVTNFDATVTALKDETDDELRARAKAVLYGVGKATVAALSAAVVETGAGLDEVWDPGQVPATRAAPGTVLLRVRTDAKHFPSVQAAVGRTRAAGVLATVVAKIAFFRPRVVATIAPGLTAAGRLKLAGQVIGAVQQYVDTLAAGKPAEGGKILDAVKSIKDIRDPIIAKDVKAYRSGVGPADPTAALVTALMDAIASAPPGDQARQAALIQVVTAAAAPTGQLIADRAMVQGPGGQRATDAEIEAWQFKVVPDADWSLGLLMDQSDVVLVEQ